MVSNYIYAPYTSHILVCSVWWRTFNFIICYFITCRCCVHAEADMV